MLNTHQERNDDGHEYGGRLGGPLQGETGGKGCEDGDGCGRGAEHRGGDGEEPRRIELKKFSLRPEKYDGKVDFEGWVNQFEELPPWGSGPRRKNRRSCSCP